MSEDFNNNTFPLIKFEKAYSTRKLRSDINPKCVCKGGFCYKWEGIEIVKACKTKEND